MGPALLPTPLSPACGSRRTLDARRLSRAARGPPRYVARRSRRCRFRRGPGVVRRPLRSRPAVPRPVFRPGFSGSAMRGTAVPSKPAGKSGLPTARLRGFNGLKVASVRSRSWLSSLDRAASRRRVECGSKISSFFRVLSHPSEEPIPALDGLKMPLGGESGKAKPDDFSTFGEIASGQRWITQRPVAARTAYPPPRGRSRCASSRNRRAFSLMKPSASCWSYAPASSSKVT